MQRAPSIALGLAVALTAPLVLRTPAAGASTRGPLTRLHRCVARSPRYHSRPDIRFAGDCVSGRAVRVGPGLLFVTTRVGTYGRHRGLLILDNRGDVVYYNARPHDVNDFHPLWYRGHRYLAWNEYGPVPGGGTGAYYLMDHSYRIVTRFTVGPRMYTDMHELQITRENTVLLSSHPDWWDPAAHRRVRDFVLREIDPLTGKVLLDFDARLRVPRRLSYHGRPPGNELWEPWHGNSMREMRDGNLLVSMRNTSSLYKLDRRTGAILWTLGGRNDSFDLTARHRAWQFCHQHDASELPNGHILVFDNGGSGTACPNHPARAEEFALNERAHTVRLVRQFSSRSASLDRRGYYAWYVGSARRLPGGDTLISWGQIPHVSEFSPSGRLNFDLTLATWTYRAVRDTWLGLPRTQPAIATRRHGRSVTVWASWNGATRVRSWRLFTGASGKRLAARGRRWKRTGFETTITTRTRPRFVAVQAYDRDGAAIGRSRTVLVR